ncbi:MAG TPA: hypothetical protein VK826_18290 [Bacteroidia bacterium]|nr:hypothetical protein [Bacteroidia bacterium]
MKVTACVFALLFAVMANAKEGLSTMDIQDGERLISISCEADKTTGGTNILCDVYGSDLKLTETKKVFVKGYAAKRCFVYAHYNRVKNNELESIEVQLNEKVFSKSVYVVWLSPDFAILNTYNNDFSEFGIMSAPHNKSFLDGNKLNCFPSDHGIDANVGSTNFSRDCWCEPGGRAYLFYDFECTSPDEGRLLYTRKPAKVDSKLYYFKATDDVIKNSWNLDIEEERILNYQIYSQDSKIFVYTSYLKGVSGAKGSEIFESRIRLIDRISGDVVYNCLLPAKNEYELMLSDLIYNEQTGEVFWAGNYVSTTETPHSENNDEINSVFVVGKINQEGVVRSIEKEVPWSASKNVLKRQTFPMIAVRSMGFTAAGDLMIAGLHMYWTMDCGNGGQTSANGQQVASSLYLGSHGLQVFYFSTELAEISSEQFVIPIAGIYDPIIGEAYCCDIRQSLVKSHHADLTKLNKASWNPETETLIMVQIAWSFAPVTKDRDYYVLKMVKGKNARFDKLSQINTSGPGASIPTIGFILNDNLFCGLKSENPKNLVVYKM